MYADGGTCSGLQCQMRSIPVSKRESRHSSGRSSAEWMRSPNLPDAHTLDKRIFLDADIFREETEKIFNKVWLAICHESELPMPLDFRTAALADGKPIVVVRGSDDTIRTFLNICPHRGNTIVRSPAGNLSVAEPSGNANHMTCMLHGWQFDDRGRCVEITREREGYQERLRMADVALREIRTEVACGGFVWINMDDGCGPLADFLSGVFDFLSEHLDKEPLEVFHYQKSLLQTNYKLWNDLSREFYHDYLHYHNRSTGMTQSTYFEAKNVLIPNGHTNLRVPGIDYAAYEGDKGRAPTFPGLAPGGWKQCNIFPTSTFNLRTSYLRVNIATPLSAEEVLLEIRGLGLKSDSAEQRRQRIKDNNIISGPFGRNVHEDFIAVENQFAAMRGNDGARAIVAREEDNRMHDEAPLRSYYAEWGKLMGRAVGDPTRRQ